MKYKRMKYNYFRTKWGLKGITEAKRLQMDFAKIFRKILERVS